MPQLRDDLSEVGGTGAQLRPQRSGVALPHVAAKRLHPRPVRRRTTGLPAAADQDPGSSRGGMATQLVRQAALADARLADEQEQASAAGVRILKTTEQQLELRLAADERRR